MKCRHCKQDTMHPFIDLGYAPPSNNYLAHPDNKELQYPLRVNVCSNCWLVQTQDTCTASELFSAEYAYFSSTSSSWLAHAKRYVLESIEQLQLNKQSFVVEVASNDGYLLKNFVSQQIPCLGIEPTACTAEAAEKKGVPTKRSFFGSNFAKEVANSADLIIGNNVYAHVPDINDFTHGLKIALKKGGTITLEFPHLLNLIQENQFDTIYHEHYSYLSLYSVDRIFSTFGLRIYDVRSIPTHGGSLRVYGCHEGDPRQTNSTVWNLLKKEACLQRLQTYQHLQQEAEKIKEELLTFLHNEKKMGRKVAAYGAAAKGNTLLNWAGIQADLIDYVCDAAPSKQGKYLPGSHIPIVAPEQILKEVPDSLIILPWNLKDEIVPFLKEKLGYQNQLVIALPKLRSWFEK